MKDIMEDDDDDAILQKFHDILESVNGTINQVSRLDPEEQERYTQILECAAEKIRARNPS